MLIFMLMIGCGNYAKISFKDKFLVDVDIFGVDVCFNITEDLENHIDGCNNFYSGR